MIESGYMQIRWYQQSSQGTNPAISEKKRLPPVAIEETRNAAHSSYPQSAARSHARGRETPKPAAATMRTKSMAISCPATPSTARATIVSCVTDPPDVVDEASRRKCGRVVLARS